MPYYFGIRLDQIKLKMTYYFFSLQTVWRYCYCLCLFLCSVCPVPHRKFLRWDKTVNEWPPAFLLWIMGFTGGEMMLLKTLTSPLWFQLRHTLLTLHRSGWAGQSSGFPNISAPDPKNKDARDLWPPILLWGAVGAYQKHGFEFVFLQKKAPMCAQV